VKIIVEGVVVIVNGDPMIIIIYEKALP